METDEERQAWREARPTKIIKSPMTGEYVVVAELARFKTRRQAEKFQEGFKK